MNAFFDDLDKYNAWYLQHVPLRAGDKFPSEHLYKIGDLPRFGTDTGAPLQLSKSGKNNFFSNFVALNGFWDETMHVRRVNGKWFQAIAVAWNGAQSTGKGVNFRTRQTYSDADDGYPHKANGKIDWDY